MGLLHQYLQQAAKHLRWPLSIGIRQRRSPDRRSTQMLETRAMARQSHNDLAQTAGAGKLAVQQRDKLILARQSTNPSIRIMFFHKPFKPSPRQKLQNVAEYCILMRHGADLHSCPGTLADVQNRLESTPSALSNNFEPDSRGTRPGMTIPDQSVIAMARSAWRSRA